MAEKIFKETNYTETLNFMIDREKKISYFKLEPWEKSIKEYEYLVDKQKRNEHDFHLNQLSKPEDIDNFNLPKQNLKITREELFKQRIVRKMQEVYQDIANQENDKISKAAENHRKNELNRKRDVKSK